MNALGEDYQGEETAPPYNPAPIPRALILNEKEQLEFVLRQLGVSREEVKRILEAANPKQIPAHIADLRKVMRALKSHQAEMAVRALTSDSDTIRIAPPYLLGKLKKSLNDFNAATMTWRKS